MPTNWLFFAKQHGRDILIVALAIMAVVMIPRRDALASCSALVATFYAATPGFGSQYMVWIIPFALAAGQSTRVAVYSAAAIPALFVYYWGTCGLKCPGYLSTTFEYWPLQWIWPVAVLWLLRDIQLAIPLRQIYARLLASLRPQEEQLS